MGPRFETTFTLDPRALVDAGSSGDPEQLFRAVERDLEPVVEQLRSINLPVDLDKLTWILIELVSNPLRRPSITCISHPARRGTASSDTSAPAALRSVGLLITSTPLSINSSPWIRLRSSPRQSGATPRRRRAASVAGLASLRGVGPSGPEAAALSAASHFDSAQYRRRQSVRNAGKALARRTGRPRTVVQGPRLELA